MADKVQSAKQNRSYAARSRQKRLARKRRNRRIVLAGMAVVFVVLVTLIGAIIGTATRLKKNQIAEGVYVDGVDLSHMTKEEAKTALNSHLSDIKNTSFYIRGNDATAEIRLSELGINWKGKTTDELVDEAYAVGRKGGPYGRYFQVKKAAKKHREIKVAYDIDDKKTESFLKTQEATIGGAPVNASLTRNGDTMTVTEGEKGYGIDVEKTTEEIRGLIGEDWDKSRELVKMYRREVDPAITADMLVDVKDLLGTYSTEVAGDEGRVQNVICGAGHINGTIVLPGEEFSADAAMTPYTEENGYTEAGSYADGEVVQTMGGGICQVSTTLYNAALYAELDITQRNPHSMTVAYVDPGRDAAIADDVKDLKFVNNTEYPIYIEGRVENGSIIMSIYGKETRDPGRTIEFEPEVTSTSDYGVRYVASYDYSIGFVDVTSYGHEGCSATLWKVVKQDGVEVERFEANESYYSSADTIITVGCASSNDSASYVVSNAVGSQDEGTIYSAINQAAGMGYDYDDY